VTLVVFDLTCCSSSSGWGEASASVVSLIAVAKVMGVPITVEGRKQN
jgi:hypothetical protein